jgi:carotenoid cleavage dioxygenase-like enzyme
MPGMPHNISTAILRHDLRDRSVRVRDFSQGPWPGLPGEPIMVPRPDARDEDDGYLLTIVYHRQLSGQRHRSALHILDARDLSTVCVASLPHHVPPGFHGSFVPADACPPGWYV